MSKKDKFIDFVRKAMDNCDEIIDNDIIEYFNALIASESSDKSGTFTENGILALKWMQQNKEAFSNNFKAKDIAEGVGITSRAMTGSLRKLANDGFLEKVGSNPVVYMLSNKGTEIKFDEN